MEVGLDLLDREEIDLIVVDPELGGIHSLDVLQTLRGRDAEVAILVLSEEKSFAAARTALRVGAVDYLLKTIKEDRLIEIVQQIMADRKRWEVKKQLYSRLESVLSRLKDLDGIDLPVVPERRVIAVSGGVMVDLDRRRLSRGQEQVSLTPMESRSLAVFLRNRGRVVSHLELVREIRDEPVGEEEAPRILRPVISRLRRKLEHFQGAGWIENVRGEGYVFDAGPDSGVI